MKENEDEGEGKAGADWIYLYVSKRYVMELVSLSSNLLGQMMCRDKGSCHLQLEGRQKLLLVPNYKFNNVS